MKRRCAECGHTFTALHKSRKLCSQDCQAKRRSKQAYAWQIAHPVITKLRKQQDMARKRMDPAYRELEMAQQRDYRRRRDQGA